MLVPVCFVVCVYIYVYLVKISVQYVSDLSTAQRVTLAVRNQQEIPQLFPADLSLALGRYLSTSEITHEQTRSRTHSPHPPTPSCKLSVPLICTAHTNTHTHKLLF